uniref:Uncharacterized protein n=1 Tax=Romanomermis culicivorax TaxID=13658 RepID=A0A915IEK8_ROMCU
MIDAAITKARMPEGGAKYSTEWANPRSSHSLEWSRREEKKGKSIRQLDDHQPPSTTRTVVLVDILAERTFFWPKLYDNKAENPNHCRYCGFSTSAMSSADYRAASPAVDYANYCSLPRRKTTASKKTINITVGPSTNDVHFQNTASDHENPADYFKLLKKTSIRSKMDVEYLNQYIYYANEANKNETDQFSSWRDHRMQQHLYKKAQRVYEMSCDLLQKQLEIWCKRYGGYENARKAAIVIQRAYRKYALERNFERVCSKRRSGVQNLLVEVLQSSSPTVKNCYQTKSLQNVFGAINNSSKTYSNIERDKRVNFYSTSPTNDSIFPYVVPATKQESSTMMMDNRYVSYVRISSENCSSPHIFCGSDMQMSLDNTPENDIDSSGRKQMQFDIVYNDSSGSIINYENGNDVVENPVNSMRDDLSPATTGFNGSSNAAVTDFNVQDTTS